MLDHVFCPVCGEDSPVELLPCDDGHGEDCAERVCTSCSTVVFAGVVPDRQASAA